MRQRRVEEYRQSDENCIKKVLKHVLFQICKLRTSQNRTDAPSVKAFEPSEQRSVAVWLLSWHVHVGAGPLVPRAHHTRHNVPRSDHDGVVHVRAAVRPRRGVHGLALD